MINWVKNLNGETKVLILAILSLAIAIFLLGVKTASACITPEQDEALRNISVATNTSYEALLSIFEMMCESIESVNQSALNNSWQDSYYNSSQLYNTTEVDRKMCNFTADINESISKLEARVNYNLTYYYDIMLSDEALKQFNDTMWEEIYSHGMQLTDIVDEKLAGIKDYATKQDITNATDPIWVYLQQKPGFVDVYGIYLFWIALFTIAAIAGLAYFKPPWLGRRFRKVEGKMYGADEETGDTEITRMDEKMKGYRKKIQQMGISNESKQILNFLLTNRNVRNDEEFDAMVKGYEKKLRTIGG